MLLYRHERALTELTLGNEDAFLFAVGRHTLGPPGLREFLFVLLAIRSSKCEADTTYRLGKPSDASLLQAVLGDGLLCKRQTLQDRMVRVEVKPPGKLALSPDREERGAFISFRVIPWVIDPSS